MANAANLGLLALTRFGCGPRGDGDTRIAASDPRGFLAAELAEPGITLLEGPGLPTTAEALKQQYAYREEQQMARLAAPSAPSALAQVTAAAAQPQAGRPTTMPPPMAPAAQQMAPSAQPMTAAPAAPPPKPPNPGVLVYRDEALARIRRAIEVRAGFAERLVAFWSNHFCVSAAKGPVGRITAGAFEREAIRPHVLGRFADMLVAVESHPAMLHFLDNAQSVGPGSRAGQHGRRGLNENLGREIMELHTLGAGSGYTQADVTNLARILTGWSIVGAEGRGGEPGTFIFRENAHEPGPLQLLGRTYPDVGVAQGRAALLDIARDPRTARFIVGKLARAFVADAPPPALVDRLAVTFTETDGDLRAVSLALIDAPEAWDPAPSKMRSPWDVVIATNRLLGHLPEDPGQVLGPLKALGMELWSPPGPNGYPTADAAWATPEGMKLRLDYCALVAAKLKTPPNPSELLDRLAGGAPSPETRTAIARAESREQGLALLLMSPEMQRS
ncbi:hypothetical protein RHAL1_03094 [Beijerinckiaceae bacterium RH AL1]|nr:DUF1800 family protein [Beijerinckiaceae bacterium]VVB47993.1 hypothetical protein RHCH11_RHCH11_03031 [Beijerinckiaceae bacterium RH CH11]VVB48070.1 hypothetical protein RHAL8_03027 [Beijerinckiaceae bacterium RH AL8]VVC56168.1 hypothetical protein RHAL1_03094 [Beijerinckiaceae bacterium RH AL1]